MSLLNTNTVTVTIKRQVTTNTDAMGTSVEYTTLARGALPTSLACRVMKHSPREQLNFEQQDETATVAFLSETNPQADERDVLEFDGRRVYVHSSVNVQELGRLWIVYGAETRRKVKAT